MYHFIEKSLLFKESKDDNAIVICLFICNSIKVLHHDQIK